MSFLSKTKESILEIILPRFCLGCGKEGRYICEDCELFLSEVENNIPFLTSCWEYEGIIKKAINKIKFAGAHHLVNELVEKASKKISLDLPEGICLTYVPMFKKEEKARGFNLASLIAFQLVNVFNLDKRKSVKIMPLLEKIKDNRKQIGLKLEERIKNVKGVFRFSPKIKDIPEKVLLVDDIYTTGATMKECIKVLKKSGVKDVWGFTLAREMNI
jgi:competence protein ComFC